MADKTPPKLLSSTPIANAAAVAIAKDIVLTFDEAVKAGTGNIVISDGINTQNVSINDKTQITFKDKTLTINPKVDLLANSHYSVMIDATAIQDLAGNKYAGIKDSKKISFDTIDTAAPVFVSITPKANATAVKINQNLIFTFNESVKLGTGFITISNGIDSQKISVTDKSQVTLNGKTLTVNPQKDLLSNSHYGITIDSSVIKDFASNKYLGITDSKVLSFDTIDTIAPVLLSSTPKPNNSTIGVNQNFTLVFSEMVKSGTGNIVISDGKNTQKILITDKSQVTFNDKTITINPKQDFFINAHYSITIDGTAIKDLAGNRFAGIKSSQTLSFYTKDTVAPILLSSSPKINQTAVKVDQNLVFTFSEMIQIGTGNIIITNGKDTTKIQITDKSQVTFTNQKITINPKVDFLTDTHYIVKIDGTAIKDATGNKFTGITDLSFDTVDTISPLLDTTITIKNLADAIAVNKSLVLTFTEAVKIGTGNIIISSSKDTRTILVSDKSQVSIDGQNVTINPTDDFVFGATYTMILESGTFKDNANNAYVGNKSLPLNFKIKDVILPPKDTTPPNLVSLAPADDSSKIAQNVNFTIKFSEFITAGKGIITLSDGSKDIRTINIESKDKQITIDKNQLIINPTLNLKSDTTYFIKIDKGVIKDLAGNDFIGITDTKTFNFKTGPSPTGTAIDDYIAGASVIVRDSDGKIYTTYTDNYGHFTFPKDTPVSSISVTGGVDIGTGNPFKGQLTAPAGASVVTPLTTLLDAFSKNGETLAQSQSLIAKAFGFDASKIDFMNYDQMAEAATNTNKTSAFNLVAINAKIVNLLIMGSETLKNTSTNAISNIDASNLMVSSLVNSISKAKETKIDLNNTAFLKDVFVGATTVNKDIKFDTTKINLVDDVFATLIADTSANIDSALSNTTQNTVTLLSNVSRVSNFTQNTAMNSIVIAISNPKTFNEKTLLDTLTGSKADEAIKKIIIPDNNLTPNPIDIIGSNTNNNTGNNTGGGTTPPPNNGDIGSNTNNNTGNNSSTTVTPVLTLRLASDTGSSSTDNKTSNGQINVANLIGGRIWEYSINGGAKQAGSGSSISVIGDGEKSVVVTQTDAKNVEKTASLTFTLDTTPPTAPTLSDKSGIVTNGSITVLGLESSATWKYSVNGTESVGSGSSFTVTGDGNKSVLVWQIDIAGNDSSKASLNFILLTADLAIPTLSLAADTGSSSTDNKTSNGQVNVFNLVSGTTWQYNLDGNNWITGSGSSFTVSGDGSKSVTVKQTNASGKVATSTSLTFDLDTSTPAKPFLTLSSYITNSNEKLTKSGKVDVANVNVESGATWQYSTDNGKSWVLGSGSSFTLTGDGTKSVLVKQTDSAGNSTVSESLSFTLDATAPATPVLSLVEDTGNPTDSITGNGGVKFTKETNALWYYSTDDSSWTQGNDSTFTITGDGSKSVFVKQIDIAGNESTHGRLNFTLTATKPSAPTLSLASDTGNPSDSITNNGQVNVFGLSSGSSWQYSIDNGTNWITGNGSNFSVTGDGAKIVLVKQIDSSGNSSTISTLNFSLITSLPATPSIDSISSDGQVNISGLVSNGIWQYSVESAVSWNVGSGSSFKITGNTTKSLLVKQTDGAGNVSANASLNFSFASGVYTGTPPNVAANLDSLEAQSITLSAIKLISSVKKTSLILTKSQLLNNQNALSRIDGTTFGTTGSFQIELEVKATLTAKEMASLLPTVGAKIKSNSVTIQDSAQNVQIYWDQLHALNIDPPIGAIYFTDKVKPKLSLSLGQYDNEQLLANTEQSGLLKFVKSPYSLVVYDVQTNDAITEALNTSISSITVTDTAAAISASFGSLINIYSIGKLNTIIVTDNKALDISSYKDLPKAADVLSKVSWLASMSDFISDYTNSAVSLITVKDSAESVQANIDLLQTSIKKLLTIELTDNSIPTITLSEQQYKNDFSVLSKINTAHELNIVSGLSNLVSVVTLATANEIRFNGVVNSLDLSGNTPITISYDFANANEVIKVSHFGEDADKLMFSNLDSNTIETLDTKINGQVATWLHSSSDSNHGIVLLGVQTANLVISDNLVTLI